MASAPTPAARPARRGRGWVVVIAIVALLAVGAWFAGEAIARTVVERTIRTQVISNLALPSDQVIDVDLPGPVLPQLIGGRLGEIGVRSDDVELGAFRGDVEVAAFDVPIRGGDVRNATALVRVDDEDLRHLMSSVAEFPVEALGIAAPDVTATVELSLFGAAVPIGVSLTPSADDGALVLTPASIQVAGADVTADELRRQFGILSNAVLRDWPVCIAQYLPAGMTLTDVAVDDDELVARFAIADAILRDRALLEKGTC
ncbi:LmeA family phospholipid-binding protein [Microbacterium sp. NPDC055357]